MGNNKEPRKKKSADKKDLPYALCFKCASIYKLTTPDKYNCPYCNYIADADYYKKMLGLAEEAVYFGYTYRKKYEEQIQNEGEIEKHYLLPEPVLILKFIGLAAVSGIIGRISYDIMMKAINKILNNSKKLHYDKKQILIDQSIDINVFIKYTQEYHLDKKSISDEVEDVIEREKIITHLTKALYPMKMEGNLTKEKIKDSIKKALEEYQNPNKPTIKDFSSFWDDVDKE